MKYFKNTELAKLYNVSEKSVRNWIQASLDGKLDLELFKERDKHYVANTTKNKAVIETLALKGKKYKNTRAYKVVAPVPKFYKLYNPKQIIDIINNLDIYKEIPLQYSYFNSGAARWDAYTHNLLKQNVPNSLTNTIQLLTLNMDYIDSLIEGYSEINVIDIGVGNALPMRTVIDHLLQKKLLKRYIAIDISKELLGIAESNIKEWFQGEVQFEGYVRDINYDRFNDLIVTESLGENAGSTLNLIFFLGGTINNFREPNHALSTIHDSMGKNDLLFFSKKLDTENSRRYFEMAISGNQELDLVLKLLNIDESLYDVEQFFDEHHMARKLQVRLKVAISVKFELYGKERIVELHKGESILLWRARHQDTLQTLQQFDNNKFDLLHASRSKDKDYLLCISKLKLDSTK